MKYVCMVRSSFLPDESNINAKRVCFNPRFFNNRVDDILTAKYDGGFPIQPTKIRSDDDRVLCLDCDGIEPEREGGSFCLSQLFPVTLTVKLILKGGAGVIWLKDEKISRVCF